MLHFIFPETWHGMAVGLALGALGVSTSAVTPPPGDPGPAIEQPTRNDRPINDLGITMQVLQMFTEDALLAETYIDVGTVGGVVTLRGRVSKLAQRERAANLANSAAGVRQVDNQLSVALANLYITSGLRDSWLATAAVERSWGRRG